LTFKNANAGEIALPGVRDIGRSKFADGVIITRAVGHPNSKCTEQNGANEKKYGAHREHIELQGKVHVSASYLVEDQS
jgi:hypothetical protein